MRDELSKRVLELRGKGYTLKQIAKTVGKPVQHVHTIVRKYNGINDYFQALIVQCASDLNQGKITYCFTKAHISAIKIRYPNLTYIENEVGYTHYPEGANSDYDYN